ncbi:MAG: PKD domain-containing protein [Bacteroidetes bacterium]|nr:PKD domain-containing protein [Bacteroidota bacterium]
MKKKSILSFFLLSSQLLLAQNTPTAQDDPQAARQHEFNITHDPNTNDIPTERLLPIIDSVSNYFNSNPGTKTVSNWTERGPNNVGGRTRALIFDPNDPTHKKVWAGGVNGGLWFTNDITATNQVWNIVDNFWVNMAVTCIAVAPNNPQIMYVGTGEGYRNIDGARGSGIWKTTDGGITWNQLASTHNQEKFNYVQKIVVTSTGVVLAGTRSRFCNGTSGVLRSADGGTTWTRVLGTSTSSCASSNTACADLEIGPTGIIYASMGISYTGNIYKSIDGGLNWVAIGGNGFPVSGYRRIEIAVAPSNPNRIYAMVENASNGSLLGIYTSTNQGSTWTTCTLPTYYYDNCTTPSSDMTNMQCFYDLILTVDPANENILFAGGIDVLKSTNAGNSWTQITNSYGYCGLQYVHADQHAMVFQPGSSSVGIFGNDGGVYYSSNLTATTPTLTGKNQGYNVTQFYSCAISPNCTEDYIIAGTQDNGTHRFLYSGINAKDRVLDGDGGFCFIDQTNPNIKIVSHRNNNFYLSSDNFDTYQSLTGSFNLNGLFINPADYDDANHILYTAYSATQIDRISGILTTPTEATITITGMSATPTHIRVSPYAAAGTTTLFVGTSNGSLYKVTNAQATPTTTNLTGTGSPWGISASISCVEIGATENDLLVTFSNYGVVSVWRTTNGGLSWTNKEGNLPDMPVHWAIYNPNDLNEVYLATELGVWSTTNISATSPTWVANNNGLANTRISMFQIRKSDNLLVAATFGRGLYTSTSFGGASAAPFPDFDANNTTICQGTTVNYSNLTCGNATSWTWTFQGGTPATSTLQNPTVTYNTIGTYSVSLTATNSYGSQSKTKTGFISVVAPPTTLATASITTLCPGQPSILSASTTGPQTPVMYTNPGSSINIYQDHISLVQFNSINNATGAGGVNGYSNYTASVPATTVNAGQSYNLTVNVAYGFDENAAAWFDWNRNGQFEPTEFVNIPLISSGTSNGTVSVLVPINSAAGTIRLRVRSKWLIAFTSTESSSAYSYGETEDYLVNIIPSCLFSWQPGSLSGSPLTVTPSSATVYTVTSTAANGCISTATANITNLPTPTVNAGPDIILTCTVPSSVIGISAISGNTYSWSPAVGLSSTTIAQPIATSTTTTTYTVTATSIATGCTAIDSVLVSVVPCSTILTTKLILQGFYSSPNLMSPVLLNQGVPGAMASVSDSITVELHQSTAPYALVASVKVLLNTNGTATCVFPPQSGSLYIVIKHRNSIETWSSTAIAMGTAVNYDFSTSANKAYGNNMAEVDLGVWALYSGDINQDQNIDLLDISSLQAEINNFNFGYYATDLNGDGNVDLLDGPTIETNINGFIFSNFP